MNRIVGLLMLGFFGFLMYRFVNKPEDVIFGVRDYAQLAVSGGAAIYLLVVLELDNIKKILNNANVNTSKKSPTDIENIKVDKEVRYYDYICLSYLRDRCQQIESEEALDHIIELNTLLFKSKISRD